MCLHDPVNSTVAPSVQPASTKDSNREDVGVALRWLAWVIGLALLWYVLGFASNLARDNVPGAPAGGTLALPLYPSGYGRLVVGALVASTIIGLVGRRASRVWPAGLLAVGLAWVVARAGLAASPQARLYGNERLVLFATILLAVATLVGLGLGVWGGRGAWQRLVTISVVVAIATGYVSGVISDLQSALTAQPSISITGSQLTRWLTLAALFGLAVAVAAMGKAHWLVLTAATSVGLPAVVTVLTYLSQLIRPGVAGNVAARILAPIADLVPAVLRTSTTWWPPLAVLAGGAVVCSSGRLAAANGPACQYVTQPIP